MERTIRKQYKGVYYTVSERYYQETMNFGFQQTTCSCTLNGQVSVVDDEKSIKSFITRQVNRGKTTSKEILSTLRTYDTTQICKLYKRIFGNVPTETNNYTKHLDYGKIYDWAKDYATSKKMDRRLYWLLSHASHAWKYTFEDMIAAYNKHGYYKPLLKQHIVDCLKEYCADAASPYSKRPIYGKTHLYFCSQQYGHADYNKWRAIKIEDNEKFCELLIQYANKFFK